MASRTPRPRAVFTRSLLLALGLTAVAILAPNPVWAAVPSGGRIGPDQIFGALVNDSTGSPTPVTIRMACFGPIRPGQTGHPFAGQTVAVFRPEAIRGVFGFTGSVANSIGAFFGAPPTTAAPSYIRLTRYGIPRPIPTSLELPCSGSGQVTFVPLPMSLTARAAIVPVSFVGQP